MQGDLEDGTWLSLAQINDNESHYATAEIAWLAAKNKAQDVPAFTFAMRGLASNLFQQGKLDEAEKAMQLAVESSLGDTVEGTRLVNTIPAYARPADAAATHAFWLAQANRKDCPFIVEHFDRALTLITEASRNLPIGRFDFGAQNQIVGARAGLSSFRKAREACEPSSVALQTEDTCYLVANLLDNAAAGFGIYKGYFDQRKNENWSRVRLPETDFCAIDSRFTFYCIWPESDEADTKMRSEMVVRALLACKNLGIPSITEYNDESNARTLRTLYLKFADRTYLKLKRSFQKPNEKQSTGRWDLTLEIDAQVRSFIAKLSRRRTQLMV